MNSLWVVEIYIVLNAEPQLRQTGIIFDFDVFIFQRPPANGELCLWLMLKPRRFNSAVNRGTNSRRNWRFTLKRGWFSSTCVFRDSIPQALDTLHKKSFSTSSTPALFHKIVFGIRLVFGFSFSLGHEDIGSTFLQLLFPLLKQIRMNLILTGDFRYGQIPPQRFQRHSTFEFAVIRFLHKTVLSLF